MAVCCSPRARAPPPPPRSERSPPENSLARAARPMAPGTRSWPTPVRSAQARARLGSDTARTCSSDSGRLHHTEPAQVGPVARPKRDLGTPAQRLPGVGRGTRGSVSIDSRSDRPGRDDDRRRRAPGGHAVVPLRLVRGDTAPGPELDDVAPGVQPADLVAAASAGFRDSGRLLSSRRESDYADPGRRGARYLHGPADRAVGGERRVNAAVRATCLD